MSLPSYTNLLFNIDRHIATITLNRPDKRNAFNDAMIQEITAAIQYCATHTAVRAVIIAAQGKAFCAGADLNWMRAMADYTHEENLADADQLARMLTALYECPKPTIAAIQGDVYAGGMGLVACCDIAIAVNSANFCLSEVKLGLIPATISPYVIRAMGARAAHRYFLTAEVFNATQAQQIGFIHERVSEENFTDTIDRVARHLTNASPDAASQCKQLLQTVAHAPIEPNLVADTVTQIADIRASEQGREGIQSFLQKRSPAWLSH